MGHKVHPMGFRLGVIKGWQSRWYADDKHYKELVAEDIAIRKLINKDLSNASVARIEIERVAGTQISVMIHTAKPGIVIGKSGEKVERLRQTLETLTKKKVHPKIIEIRNPEVEAVLVGKSIAEQLEKRISFRRAMKQAVQKSMRAGAKGIKVICSGRLGGAEIARTEREVEGSVPLQTLRADIDFAVVEAHTTFGTIGIKVWIYRGDVLSGPRQSTSPLISAEDRPRRENRGFQGERSGPRDRDRGGPRGGAGGRDGGGRAPYPSQNRGPRPGGPGMGAGPGMGTGPDRGPRPAGTYAPRPAGNLGPRPVGQGAPGQPAPQPVPPQTPAPAQEHNNAPTNPTPAPDSNSGAES